MSQFTDTPISLYIYNLYVHCTLYTQGTKFGLHEPHKTLRGWKFMNVQFELIIQFFSRIIDAYYFAESR